MENKIAGQTCRSNFETIKTLYWFGYVKNKVRTEILLETKQEIAEIECSKNRGDKWSRSRLRTLINKLNRLTGNDNFKKSDIKYSEIQNHLAKIENRKYPKELITPEGVGKLSGKVWGRYASGLHTPSRILNELTLIYPESKLAYIAGPNNLFTILEANTLKQALETLRNTLIDILRTKEDCDIYSDKESSDGATKYFLKPSSYIKIIEDVFIQNTKNTTLIKLFDNLFELFTNLQDILEREEKLYFSRLDSFKTYKHIDAGEAACLYLSFAYLSYKFLGEPKLLPAAIHQFYVLDVIEQNYDIKATSWFIQNNQKPSNIISIFIEAANDLRY